MLGFVKNHSPIHQVYIKPTYHFSSLLSSSTCCIWSLKSYIKKSITEPWNYYCRSFTQELHIKGFIEKNKKCSKAWELLGLKGVMDTKFCWAWCWDIVGQFKVLFLLPQVNGCACVDFGCTHSIDGLFWSLLIYLLGSSSKYKCCVIDLIMLLDQFFFFGVVTCLFVSQGFISLWNVKKIHMIDF